MNAFSLYTIGLPQVFNFDVLSMLFIGVTAGVIIGALPGLSATMGVAVMTPLTYGMGTIVSFALLLGVYCGGIYAGSITAIIAKIPELLPRL
jgi:putative tricarboxylic transport membrane protein